MLALVTLAVTAPLVQDPAPGISLDLARARARAIVEPHYILDFALTPGADHVDGHAVVRFRVRDDAPPGDVVLDFAGTACATSASMARPPTARAACTGTWCSHTRASAAARTRSRPLRRVVGIRARWK